MHEKEFSKLSLEDLRQHWARVWGHEPHVRISRTMLEKSLAYMLREEAGKGLTQEQHSRLAQLVKKYRRNPRCFDKGRYTLKPGIRLVRYYDGQKHSVLVTEDGFDYAGQYYSSLSKIATEITGTRRNGRSFFRLDEKEAI